MKGHPFGKVAYAIATIVAILWVGLWYVAYRTAGFDCINSLEPVDFDQCLRSNQQIAMLCLSGGLLVWLFVTGMLVRNRKRP